VTNKSASSSKHNYISSSHPSCWTITH